MATETAEKTKTCKDCKYWDFEWIRKPEDDPDGQGYRYCYHPGFIGGMKWAVLLTGPDSLPNTGKQCIGFEINNGN